MKTVTIVLSILLLGTLSMEAKGGGGGMKSMGGQGTMQKSMFGSMTQTKKKSMEQKRLKDGTGDRQQIKNQYQDQYKYNIQEKVGN